MKSHLPASCAVAEFNATVLDIERGEGDPAGRDVATSTRDVPVLPIEELLAALVVMAVVFLWFEHYVDPPMTEFERTRDFLSAQDCHLVGRCSLVGPPSSTLNLRQGAVWIEILTAVEFLRGSPAAVLRSVNALLAMGVATVFLVAWRWLRPAIALPSVLVALALLDRVHAAGQFVNPCTEFLPAAWACAALLIFALTGRTSLLMWATLFLSQACNTHTGSLCLVPAWVVLAAIAGLPELALAVGIFLAASWITSSEALLHNLRDSAVDGRLVVVALLALVTAASVLAPRFFRLGAAGRAAVLGAMMVGPFAAYMTYRAYAGLHYEWLYWPPVIAPIAVGTSALFVGVVERLATRGRWLDRLAPVAFIAAGAGIGCLTFQPRLFEVNNWTYETVRIVQNHRWVQGWSYSRLARGLQVENRYNFLLGLMPYARPDPLGEAPFDPHRQMRVWLRSANDPDRIGLPRGAEVVPVRNSKGVLVFSPIDSWLDPWRDDICVASQASSDAVCSHLPRSPDVAILPFSFSNRLLMGQGLAGSPGQTGCRISHVIPVQPSPGAVHLFASPNASWRFTRVTGIDVLGELPARHMRLRSREGAPGQITMEADFGPGSPECGSSHFPEVMESLPDDPPWTQGGSNGPIGIL